VVRCLGRGATAAVYLARDRELHRLVAVKALHPELAADAAAAGRFREEARLSVQLTHPGIVPVYGYDRAAALPYLVMQYVDGGSLADRLDRVGRLSVEDARRVLLELADVLDYAHRRGVVHRDVKPENVLLATFGASFRPLLCDFGVAVQPFRDRGAGHAEEPAGTAAYASPEQWWGPSDVDRRSDLYALGVLGYRMLAGRTPYEGATAAAIAARQAAGGHTPLAAAAPHAPRALCAAIERCLALEPAARWRNAREFRDAVLAAEARGWPALHARLARLFRWRAGSGVPPPPAAAGASPPTLGPARRGAVVASDPSGCCG
jgi:serine/threonine-protein kinase